MTFEPLMLLLALALAPVPAAAQVLRGTVTHIEDGDALTLAVGRNRHSVRLADIDAPEICHYLGDPDCRKPAQPYGDVSASHLRTLALGKEAEAACRDTSHGRLVCYVRINVVDLSQTLAREGLAWFEPRYGQDLGIRQAAAKARASRRGMWAWTQNVEPWIWRRTCWANRADPVLCVAAGSAIVAEAR